MQKAQAFKTKMPEFDQVFTILTFHGISLNKNLNAKKVNSFQFNSQKESLIYCT